MTGQQSGLDRNQQLSAAFANARLNHPSAEKAEDSGKDYFTSREIDRLADKIEKAFTYDRFAQKSLPRHRQRGGV
jgi:hypothetical protein